MLKIDVGPISNFADFWNLSVCYLKKIRDFFSENEGWAVQSSSTKIREICEFSPVYEFFESKSGIHDGPNSYDVPSFRQRCYNQG